MIPFVEVAPRKWIAPPMFAAITFVFQIQFSQSTTLVALMAALAVLTCFTSMILREAEWCALRGITALNRKDLFGYGCAFVFDVTLILGLIVGAGDWTSFGRFFTLALVVAAAVVIAMLWESRKDFDPENAEPGIRRRHWLGPVGLLAASIVIWVAQGVQAPSGSQPFVVLVGISVIIAALDPRTEFAGLARVARSSLAGLALVLLLLNVLQLT